MVTLGTMGSLTLWALCLHLTACFKIGPNDQFQGSPGCKSNQECTESGVCTDIEYLPYKPGTCINSQDIVYVYNKNCPMVPDGSREKPYCSLSDAVSEINKIPNSTKMRFVHVKGSTESYDDGKSIPINAENIAIIGPWADPQFNGSGYDNGNRLIDARIFAIAVNANHVFIDGFKLGQLNGNNNAVLSDGSLTIRRCSAVETGTVQAVRGSIIIDRSIFSSTIRPSITLGSASLSDVKFVIKNSWIKGCPIGNRISLSLEQGVRAEGKFYFNDVFGNGCTVINSTSRTDRALFDIRNSVFSEGATYSANLEDWQARGIVTMVDFARISESPEDYRLRAIPQNANCCIDKATADADEQVDFFGNPRPNGPGRDIGFHELTAQAVP